MTFLEHFNDFWEHGNLFQDQTLLPETFKFEKASLSKVTVSAVKYSIEVY